MAPQPPDAVDAARRGLHRCVWLRACWGYLRERHWPRAARRTVDRRAAGRAGDDKGPAGQRTAKTRVNVSGSGSRITMVSRGRDARGAWHVAPEHPGASQHWASTTARPGRPGHRRHRLQVQRRQRRRQPDRHRRDTASTSVPRAKPRPRSTTRRLLARIDQELSVEHSTRGGQGSPPRGRAQRL